MMPFCRTAGASAPERNRLACLVLNNRIGAKAAVRRILLVGVATAVTAAGGAALAEVVAPDPIASPSFNGSVYAVAYRGDTVYVGGSFTAVRTGGKTVTRKKLAAYNARTGALLSWNPTANGTVRALAVSGGAVYAAGDFSTVAGRRRDSLARIGARSGAVWSFAHSVSGDPVTLAVGGGKLYVGGRFSAVDRVRRGNLAAFSLTGTALDRRWAPTADGSVHALAYGGSRVYVGGSFRKVDGASGTTRLAAVTSRTGAVVRAFRPATPAEVLDLAVDSRTVYAGTGGAGGRAIGYTGSGAVRWTHLFDGDVHTITALRGVAYVGGHFDTACRRASTIKQLGCVGGRVSRVKLAAIGTNGQLSSWNPRANGVVGVHALAANIARGEIAAGGAFTTIGGAKRERFVSFR
jgi:hypothetical protein